MNATGLPVPDTSIQELGSSRKPAVTVTIGTYSYSSTVSYRSTVSSRQGGYILPLSSIHRDATGLSAFDALSASRRGALVHQVESAKAAGTRARRVARIATQLDE